VSCLLFGELSAPLLAGSATPDIKAAPMPRVLLSCACASHVIGSALSLRLSLRLPSPRAGIEWYQYDPTKLFIRACAALGCAYDLKVFPQNEVDKGVLQMRQKALDVDKLRVDWGPTAAALPVWTRAQFDARAGEEKAKWAGGDKSARILFILDGFVLDVAPFLPLHPGGGALLSTEIGNDVTVRDAAVCRAATYPDDCGVPLWLWCAPAAASAGGGAELRQCSCLYIAIVEETPSHRRLHRVVRHRNNPLLFSLSTPRWLRAGEVQGRVLQALERGAQHAGHVPCGPRAGVLGVTSLLLMLRLRCATPRRDRVAVEPV